MAAPIVYRWDDSGAPVARGERASLCDILYACLVAGYGSKAAAGWTREYVNGTYDKAAFRPGAGTRFYLQVDGAGAVNAYTPKVQGFESMTSESDGLLPFNASVQTTQTSSAANTTARPWIVIADARFFYFLCWNSITATPTTADTGVSGMFFGDIVEIDQNDEYACTLLASSYGFAPSTVQPNSSVGSTYDPRFPRKMSGAAGTSHVACVIHNGGPCIAGTTGVTGPTYSVGGPVFYTKPFVNNGENYTIRGWLPGFHYPCHPHPFSQFQQLTLDGKNFIAFKTGTAGSAVGSYLISLDDWRA